MTNFEYLRQLAQALTRLEDLTTPEAKDVLYELALRIYALLLRLLPEGRMERYMQWSLIRAEILIELQSASAALGAQLYSRIAAAEMVVREPTATFYDIPLEALPPRPLETLLDSTIVLGTPISTLYTPDPATGYSPFTLQLMRLLERSVLALFFQEASTAEIANRVMGQRMVGGVPRPLPSRGTVANAWVERYRAIVAASLWSVVTPTQLRAVAALRLLGAPTPTLWVWNAILDPRTCPICRPLDGTTAPTPDAFPRGAPPLHPLCRCIVLPARSAGAAT